MEYIKFGTQNNSPEEAAKKAYANGYYIEAIQTLHGFIENQANELLLLIGCEIFNSKQIDIWDLAYERSFSDTLKVLRILNQITQEEYIDFKKFNSLRNKIIHQYYKEPYEKIYDGIPKREYDEVFKETIKQIHFFGSKSDELIFRQ